MSIKQYCDYCGMMVKMHAHPLNLVWWFWHRYILDDIEILCPACHYQDH